MSTGFHRQPPVPMVFRSNPVELVTDNLETPSVDDRSYRVIKLANKLEVLLVHDADTDKASAAMDVNVGSFKDDESTPGLAHALEHMLFMGTKKYPIENEYNTFLSAHSGHSNAFTASTSTNYFFEIAAKPAEEGGVSPLHGALDRFAQFFIEPLFLDSTLDRELRAVDSENKKNLQSDNWRLRQLEKSLSNPKHPYCHFSTGNLETLKTIPESTGINVREEFIKFHENHYSANRMKLVVLGREPLDELEKWVVDLFSGIENKNRSEYRWDEAVLTDRELLTQIFAKPVMNQRSLEITFPFLSQERLFESQPSHYISHLIGHEGPGSIMSYVKSKGWASGLSAGEYDVGTGAHGLFHCEIRLTEDGLENYKEIVKVFFQYVSLLKETGPQEWIFDEQKGLADVAFKFRQKTPASKFTSHISGIMQSPLPREWLLSGNSRLRKYEPELIKQALSSLRPDNFRITVVSQGLPGNWDQKEKWYGTEYKYEKIPLDFLTEIKDAASTTAKDRLPELHLPHKNQFIPTNLEVEKKAVKEASLAPKLVRNDDAARVWFKKDDTFWVPKANVYISLKNPLPSATAENVLKARLYAELVKDNLEEYSYDADLAGLEYNIFSHMSGFDIEVSGYNDKLPVLLEKVLTTMRDFEIRSDRFEIVKERFDRSLRNSQLQQPYTQVSDYVRWLTNERGFINDQFLSELPSINAKDIQSFYPQMLRQLHIETFVHGNMWKEDSLRLTNLVQTILKPRSLPQAQWPVLRSLLFPPGSNYIYKKTLKDPANVNHCIEYVLHIGDKADRALRAKVLLLEQMAHEPAFDQLRTKEQLGYVVFSGSRTSATTIGYRFIIQSERTPVYLESRIEQFLEDFKKRIEEMSDWQFEDHKQSVITRRLEKLKNLNQESNRLWSYISSEYFDFGLVHHDAEEIKKLKLEDMIKFFDLYISPYSPQRAKLVVHLQAQASSPESKSLQDLDKLEDAFKTCAPAHGIDSAKLAVQKTLETVGSGEASIQKALKDHFMKDLKLSEDDASALIQSGMKIYYQLPNRHKQPAILIENVRDFKSKLAVTAGPQPVTDLSEFEDYGMKL